MTRRPLLPVLAVLALAILAVVLVLLVVRTDPGGGWFAYTPLSDDGPQLAIDGKVVLDEGRLVLGLVGAGALLVLSCGVGFWLGRRRPGQSSSR